MTTNGAPDKAAFSANSGRVSISDSTNPSCFLSEGSSGGLQISGIGFVGDSISFTLGSPNSIRREPFHLPSEYAISQNYPNPFNPSTTIRYGLPQWSQVTLTVFNTLGQQVAVLQNGEQEAGYHEVKFDANGLSSGVYFYRLSAGEFVQTKKLLLVH